MFDHRLLVVCVRVPAASSDREEHECETLRIKIISFAFLEFIFPVLPLQM